MDSEAELRRLIDERDVSQVILRYAQGLDSREFAQVWDCFAPDAICHGSTAQGTLDEYLPPLLAGVENFGATMHFMGNQLIEIDGDTATTETYCIAHHFSDEAGREEALVMGVRYFDELVRHPRHRWVIQRRRAVPHWLRVADDFGPFPPPPDGE